MVGKKYEAAGIAKNGAKMVNAVANANVPKFTLLAGNSYGAGNYGMCGRAYDPELLLTWPNSRIAVMGASQAAGVLSSISGGSASSEQLTEEFEEQSKALYASSMLWDDGIISPSETRSKLASGFAACLAPDDSMSAYGIFRM